MTSRQWRMTSGLVMLGYVCMHLGNHILGIVSLSLAEAGLRVSMSIWHSVPGTIALYGAFVVHFALALRTIYLRRHWQLPATEWIRLWAGFSLPLLLIGHAVSTRVAASFYGFEPSYEKIISGLIAGGSQGWQIALLAPGWLHGSLGLWIALRHFALMQRIRPALIGVLVAVPLLSAVGFLRMSAEVEVREASMAAHVSDQKRRAAPLAQWRETLLALYLLTIAGAFVAGRWRARYIPE